MNLLMVTNTFTPHIGGVARSVTTITDELRRKGHRVLVVAPLFDGAALGEADVVRTRALTNFHGTNFSVVLPPRLILARVVDHFKPDIIHSHHPFLLGATAARVARRRKVPLVFTHHTLYERYTHYVPGDLPGMSRLAVRLCTRYANRSNCVFAPSQSVVEILRDRGVTAPIAVVPSGVRLADFRYGNGEQIRFELGLPEDAFVVGHVGRLAEEKNLSFLASAIAQFLSGAPEAYALIVGQGAHEGRMRSIFRAAGVERRVRFAGTLTSSRLTDAYKAMDVFAFASVSETQGLVLAEAMAAGVPAVALDGPGVREVLCDGVNGRLLPSADEASFAGALGWAAERLAEGPDTLRAAARASANSFSLELTAEEALGAYERLLRLRRYAHAPAPERRDAGPAVFKPTRLLPNYGFRAAKTLVGVIAIAAGLALLIANPGSLHSLVQSATAAELAEDPSDLGANLLRDGFEAFVPGDAVFVAAFLLLRGLNQTLISVAPSVRCRWATSVGGGLAGVFIVWTAYSLSLVWSWALVLFAVLNVVTLSGTLREWRALRKQR